MTLPRSGAPTGREAAVPQQRHARPTILHNYSYVSPAHVARRIRAMRHVCNTESFLNCCVEYNEIKRLCVAFAAVLGDTALEDPDAFHKTFESNDEEDDDG